MQLLHPAINALRSGNTNKMAKFDDLLATNFDPFDAKHFSANLTLPVNSVVRYLHLLRQTCAATKPEIKEPT